MKKIFLIVIYIVSCNCILGQNIIDKISSFLNPISSEIQNNIYSLQKVPDVSLHDVISVKLNELMQAGEYFKYSKQLDDGSYIVQFEDDKVFIKLLKNNEIKQEYNPLNRNISRRAINEKEFTDVITFKVNKIGDYWSLDVENLNDCIDLPRYESYLKNNNLPNSLISNYIWKDRIIIDKEILNNFSSYVSGQIVNRTKTRTHLFDIYGNPCDLYGDITAGTIIPYSGGQRAKIFTVDKLWSRIIWFDRDRFNPTFSNSPFALYSPQSNFSLSYPTDVTYGTLITRNNNINTCGYTGIDSVYYLYISDCAGHRIAKVEYRIRRYRENCNTFVTQYSIEDNTFSVIKGDCLAPYSIAFHKGNNQSDISDDVIWYSDETLIGKKLNCINANTGADVPNQSITALDFGRGAEPINPRRISIYQSPDGLRNILCFVDETRNSLIFLKLNQNGALDNSASNCLLDEVKFGEEQKLQSVILTSNNTGIDGVTVWAVTNAPGGCGPVCGSIHTLKVNYIINTPVGVDYLASYWRGDNSQKSFVSLNNLHAQNGFIDIFTMEKWDDEYGLRRFKPGLDMISSSASDYCREVNNMKVTLRVTNPCRIEFQDAEFKAGLGSPWVVMPGMVVNGIIPNSQGFCYIPSGTVTLNIYVPGLPTMGDVPPPQIKIKLKVCPQDENMGTSSYKIEREFIVNMANCNYHGGCPFVLVKNIEGFQVDNNILHRSEFSGNENTDIEDKYLLKVIPDVNQSDSTCQLKINELNNDISYFDKFSLVAIDHPIGTDLGITEANDYVLYIPTGTNSPSYANHEGEDVTAELNYDSSYSKIVEGDEEDNVYGNFTTSGENSLKTGISNVISNALSGLNYSLQKKSKITNSKKVNNQFDFGFTDSVAVMIDPSQSDAHNTIWEKDIAGTLSAFDTQEDYVIEDIPFAKRQNSSTVIIPVGKNVNIDSVSTVWNSDFQITFLAVSPVYYGGYIENSFELIEALDSLNGNVTSSLQNVDQNYAVMDASTNILLKFKNTFGEAPEGWVRDYVLIVNGRYEKVTEGDNLLTSSNQNPIIPTEYRLYQNYPNPFNPITIIKFDLPKEGIVSVKIYDVLGKEVYSSQEFKEAGQHVISFNGSSLSSGVYFYKIESGKFRDAKRMLLLK